MTEMTIATFRSVPPVAVGLVRDLRIRWALEELGRTYDTLLIDQDMRATSEFRAMQPFGQLPAVRMGGETLFETGAILFAIAEHTSLMAPGLAGRNATLAWMFAALNTVEPDVAALATNDFFRADEPWVQQSRSTFVGWIERKLAVLEDRLASRDYLLDQFTVADILMTTVLRFLKHTEIVSGFPAVAAYRARCEARPAFQKALAAQLQDYDMPVAIPA